MKHEWKKRESSLYGAKGTPALITVPMQRYLMQDGTCIEVLHIGAFNDEPASFEKIAQFAADHGLTRDLRYHREIYLNNANRVEKSKLKTILRCPLEGTCGAALENPCSGRG